MKKKLTFYIIVTILWMGLIFVLSSKPPASSHNLSKGLIKDFVLIIEKVFNTNLNEVKIANTLNYGVRKTAHYSIYFVLAIFIYKTFSLLNIKQKSKLTILICFLYSITDEIHQLFVGRSGMIWDSLLDTLGSITIVIILSYFEKKKDKHIFTKE